MKEYKVVTCSMGLTNNDQKMEDLLNKYALQGWIVKAVGDSSRRIVFERDKHR